MFAEQPDLLDGLFNRGNQTIGQQRRAPARSIAAFAQALLADPDGRPDTLLSRIAHRHAGLGVTEDQYTIVHRYLFRAIAEVLGDAVTAEVAAAWGEVYWLMAGALIAREARLYQEAQVDPRHPWRQWTVVERREETPDAVSFLLRPADDGPIPPARAGQYASVRVEMPDGIDQLRQYSLSGVPGDRLAASPSNASRACPTLLKAKAPANCTAPSGPATDSPCPPRSATWSSRTPTARCCWSRPASAAPPMVGMLEHLAATGAARPVTVLHADRSPADDVLHVDTRRLVDQLPNVAADFWYEQDAAAEPGAHTGLMDLGGLDLPSDADVYLCGSLPFMRAVRAQLLQAGIPARRIRYEVFGPDLWLAHAEG